MPEVKYRYDPNTLTYTQIKLTAWDYFKRSFGLLVIAMLLAVGIFFMYYKTFDSLKEKALKKEIQTLEFQYGVINRKINSLNEVLDKIKQRDHNIYRSLFEGEPVDEVKISMDFIEKHNGILTLPNAPLLISTKTKVENLELDLFQQSLSLTDVEAMVKDKKNMLSSIPAIQPVSNKNLKRMASGYGHRKHPIYKTWKFHAGMDFSADKGTPVYATGDGKVVVARKSKRGLGYHLVIDHGYSYKTIYAHMDDFSVKSGDRVKRGQVIGFVGNTGASTGPHLHYEVKKRNKHVNPINYYYEDLTPEQYEKMLEMSSMNRQSLD